VTAATFDEDANAWTVETDRGDRVSARYVITAVGALSAANTPSFEGIESFEGATYHTAAGRTSASTSPGCASG
jgi:cation diffusion facilitator CzcD-associated flavoprotein CzcO